MNIDQIKHVYLIGIGGIGMSALAKWFFLKGKHVAGYDKTPSSVTDQLQDQEIEIHFEDNTQLIPKEFLNSTQTLIIYTPAIPKDHNELNYFIKNNFTVMKRAEVLGLITQNHFTVAVAGTHGKTTTSSMIAHLLHTAGKNMVAFLGGIMQNYNSNLIVQKNSDSQPEIVVVEADEYDRSFHQLRPNITVITSIDPDHLDIYGDKNNMIDAFQKFVELTQDNGILIKHNSIQNKKISKLNLKEVYYGFKEDTNHTHSNFIKKFEVKNNELFFDAHIANNTSHIIKNLNLKIPGQHNTENMLAAISAVRQLNIDETTIKKGVETYPGVKRRFEYIVKDEQFIFIDDYAHHPQEIKALLSGVRQLYPSNKITAIFQPHLYSRTRDFASEFGESLQQADEIILLDIYPAREKPIPGVSSQLIFENIKSKSKKICKKEDLLVLLENSELEILLTLGAGDIDRLIKPIAELLQSKATNRYET